MLKFKIDLTPESRKNIARFPEAFKDALKPTFEKIMLRAEAHSKTNYFLDGGSGINFKLLTSRSGNLRRSIRNDVRQQGDRLFAFLLSTVEYAATHEYGDRRRNIKARPFLTPAIIDVIEDENTEIFLIKEIDKLTRWR